MAEVHSCDVSDLVECLSVMYACAKGACSRMVRRGRRLVLQFVHAWCHVPPAFAAGGATPAGPWSI
jgi:hypothetical protein